MELTTLDKLTKHYQNAYDKWSKSKNETPAKVATPALEFSKPPSVPYTLVTDGPYQTDPFTVKYV